MKVQGYLSVYYRPYTLRARIAAYLACSVEIVWESLR